MHEEAEVMHEEAEVMLFQYSEFFLLASSDNDKHMLIRQKM